MLKTDQLFLRNFLLILLLVLLASGTATYVWFKNIYLAQIKTNLSQNIDSVSLVLPNLESVDDFVQEYRKKTGLRITFIALDGRVLAESHEDKTLMENHLHRDEIRQLKTAKMGHSIRYSKTLGKEYLYVVKQIETEEKERVYLRMADDIEKIREGFFSLSMQIIVIFVLSFIIAVALALNINKRLKKETENILEILHMLLDKKNFEIERMGELYEFNKITQLLEIVGSKLKHRENLKSKQNAKLKLANRQKDEIISALSHEFKNPIAVITGYCESMIGQQMDQSIADKFLKKIENNAHKMSAIIDKLRLAISLEDGRKNLNFEHCDLRGLCEELAQDIKQSYKGREIHIEGEGVFIEADPVLFGVALTNLMENALKYSENDVEVVVRKDYVKVVDHGIGMEKKELEKITDKFYRVSTNRWNNSLGLGLNIVDNIVRLHGFTLQIMSQKNIGSTFKITF